jgi:hypothetical protein
MLLRAGVEMTIGEGVRRFVCVGLAAALAAMTLAAASREVARQCGGQEHGCCAAVITTCCCDEADHSREALPVNLRAEPHTAAGASSPVAFLPVAVRPRATTFPTYPRHGHRSADLPVLFSTFLI